MLVVTVPARALGASCYVVAAGVGQPCLVVDPGLGIVDAVAEVVADLQLSVAAVVATHGHLDHVHDAAPLCDRFGVPLSIHAADRHLLTEPWDGVDASMRGMLEPIFAGRQWREPAAVAEISDGTVLELPAGSLGPLRAVVHHAPGHTGGSVLLEVAGAPAERSAVLTQPDDDLATFTQCERSFFTGDVLFAGSIGRTDFPGSDPAAMAATLSRIGKLPGDSVVLPGHGPISTLEREFRTNPFLNGRHP